MPSRHRRNNHLHIAELNLQSTAGQDVLVSVNRLGGAGARGTIQKDQIQVLLEDFRSGPSDGGVVLNDTAIARWEQEIGARLGALVTHSNKAINDKLKELLVRASPGDQPLVLVIETHDAEIQALPWELIGLPNCLETDRKAVVVRLVEGETTPAGTPSTVLREQCWTPDAEAPEVQRILTELDLPSSLCRALSRLAGVLSALR